MYILQISCMMILGFLLIMFLSEKRIRKATDKWYILILIVSMLQLVFECLSIWSVHRVSEISPLLFKSINRSYFTLILTYFYLGFRYKSAFVREETGAEDKGLAFIHVAQVILYAGIFILPLGYELTETGAVYNHGPGMWTVYVGAAFYLFVIFSNYVEQMRRIAREKLFPLVFGVGCGMFLCFCYMIYPVSHITGVALVVMGIAMFVSIFASDREVKAPKPVGLCEKEPVEKETIEKTVLSPDAKVSFSAEMARILLVDDTAMNRKIVRNLLQKSRIQVEEASGGEECLAMLRERCYHVIFMDHLMPEMDGLETFERIKNEHLADGVPVVVMTANAMSMTEQEYQALGFAAYLSKPVLPEKLNLMLYQLLDRSLISELEIEEPATVIEKNEEMIEKESAKEDEKENWADLPAVNGLDYDYAALHFNTAEEFTDMIRFLVGVMQSDLDQLQEYFRNREQEQELEKFCTKVHSMKNSAMTVGIVPLAGLAKTLEDASRGKNEAHMSAMMPVFADKWEEYRLLLLQKFMADASDKSEADPHSEEVTKLFTKLRLAAEEMDIDALDAIMKQIDAYAFPEEYAEKLQEIRRAVTNFDVDYLQEQGYL